MAPGFKNTVSEPLRVLPGIPVIIDGFMCAAPSPPLPFLPLAGKAVVAQKGDQPDQEIEQKIDGQDCDEHQTHVDINPVPGRIRI